MGSWQARQSAYRSTLAMALAAVVLVSVVAAPVGALVSIEQHQQSGQSFRYVEAEVSEENLFGAGEVTFYYRLEDGKEVTLSINGRHNETVTADGTDQQTTVRIENSLTFDRSDYPVEVGAKVDDHMYTAFIERDDDRVDIYTDKGESGPFESATAEVSKAGFVDPVATEVTFTYEAPAGAEVHAGIIGSDGEFTNTGSEVSDGTKSSFSVDVSPLGELYGSMEYPFNVSIWAEGRTYCEGRIDDSQETVTLCDGADDQQPAEPHFEITDIEVKPDTTVSQGDPVTVEVTVRNTGTVESTTSVTLETENRGIGGNHVEVKPHESETVDVVWDTTGVYPGIYDVSIETLDETDSTAVAIQIAEPDRVSYGGESVRADNHRVAVLLLNMERSLPDDRKRSAEEVGDLVFEHRWGVNEFVQEASYGEIELTGTVVGWINRPAMEPKLPDDHNLNTDHYLDPFRPHVDLDEYDTVFLYVNSEELPTMTDETLNRGGSGPQVVNLQLHSQTPDVVRSLYNTGAPILPHKIWAHEMSHAIGMSHAESVECVRQIVCSARHVPSDNPINPYGNPFSVMGHTPLGSHPMIFTKKQMGWLDDDQIHTAETGETTSFTIYPNSPDDGRPKAVKIPLEEPIQNPSPTEDANFNSIYLEYRNPIDTDMGIPHDFDRYLRRIDRENRTGVLASLVNDDGKTFGGRTFLLDMHPSTDRLGDAFLTVGESQTIDNQVRIETVRTTLDGGIVVEVSYP